MLDEIPLDKKKDNYTHEINRGKTEIRRYNSLQESSLK